MPTIRATATVIALLLTACANPPPAKTFGSMMGAAPACVAFCRIEQNITTDSTPASTDASTSVTTMAGPALLSK